MRANAPQAFLLVRKNWTSGKTSVVPGRMAADGTVLAEARHLVIDISIYSHMFTNVVTSPTNWREKVFVRKMGSEFVDFLAKNVDEAFAQGYKIVVLAHDKQSHTTAAKENTQSKRVLTTLNECTTLGVPPLDWDLDAPTTIIAPELEIPPMCAIKAAPSAFRYMQCQALLLLKDNYTPPRGCRLIIDAQPYDATNPATPDHWLRSPCIYVPESEHALVERLRAQLASETDAAQWRHAARKLSTELGRSGTYYTLPWCVETTDSGVRLLPYVLRNWRNTWGEADLAVWGANARLLGNEKRESLHSDERYTPDGVRYVSTNLEHRDEVVLTGRTVIATSDSDFISGALASIGAAIADYAHGKPPTYETIDEIGAFCPLVLMGDAYATELGYVRDASVYGKEAETKQPGGRALVKAFEFIDTHRLFCSLVFNRYAQPSALMLAPLRIGVATPHDWFRRALTVVAFCAIAGNDFLRGLTGMSHEPLWTALTQFTALRDGELVLLSRAFVRPLDRESDGAPRTLPSQSAVLLNPQAYTQFIKHCYHVSMVAKGGPNAPRVAANAMTYEQLSHAVANKYKKNESYHMPSADVLSLMYERTLWSLYYTLYGPVTVRRTLDETLVGWQPHVRTVLV